MFGIDMGVSKEQQGQFNQLAAGSSFATGMGEGALTSSNKFMEDLLSGDPTKVASALAPEIAGQQKQTEQAKNQIAQFGPRSGGTAAAVANMDTASRGNIINLAGGLQGGAASSLASTGTNLLGLGMEGNKAGFDEASQLQQQRLAKFNDIMSSIANVASGALTGGLG